MSFETIEFSVDDGIAQIVLDRPENANALNTRMAYELFEVAIRCSTDDSVRAVALTGRGKMFCGGGDLSEMEEVGEGLEAHLLEMATVLHQALIRFAHMDAPLIVGVNGAAGGGGFSMALAGDYIIASERAKFVSGYTASGLTPDASSTHFLAKHVGLLRAKELFLTNRALTAHEALEWGLVNRVVAAQALEVETMEMARSLASGPTKAFGGVKRLLMTTYSDGMESQLDKEAQGISGITKTHDAPHGIASFLHKQKPSFEGR